MDVSEALAEKIPSIVAQNMAQGGKANVERGKASPESQGRQGGNNAPNPARGKPPELGNQQPILN